MESANNLMNQVNQILGRVNEAHDKASKLEGAYEHLATKADLWKLAFFIAIVNSPKWVEIVSTFVQRQKP